MTGKDTGKSGEVQEKEKVTEHTNKRPEEWVEGKKMTVCVG